VHQDPDGRAMMPPLRLIMVTLSVWPACTLGGTAPPDISGAWQITGESSVLTVNGGPLPFFLSGQISQVGSQLSGNFGVTGTPCGTGATIGGSVSSTGQLNATITYSNFSGQAVSFAGVVSLDGYSASGTYVAPATGCSDGDYGVWSGTRSGAPVSATATLGSIVSGGSFSQNLLSSGAFATLFGADLSTQAYAAQWPLPTQLGATTALVCDSNNLCLPAQLSYVGPSQINFLMPAGANSYDGWSGSVSVIAGTARSESIAFFASPYAPDVFFEGYDCPITSPLCPLWSCANACELRWQRSASGLSWSSDGSGRPSDLLW
jgi:hypothetical protein